MPVNVAITVADPPSAPTGYTVCAFVVANPAAVADGLNPLVNFPGTTDGYESAVNVLVSAVLDALAANDPLGFRLAAVAWWSEKALDLAPPGRERLVSVYDAGAGRWREWVPESRIQPARVRASLDKYGQQRAGIYTAID